MHDPSGRRGLWFRAKLDEHFRATELEVCGGREGDDAYGRIAAGEVATLANVVGFEHAIGICATYAELLYSPEDEYRRDDPTVAAIVATARERDEARVMAMDALREGLAECERLRAELAALRGAR
jgi:hypothetical protein